MDIIVGSIIRFAHNWEQPGWFYCDGRTLKNSSFPELFSVIGYDFGGDRQKTFALPDLRPRDNNGDLLNVMYGDLINGMPYIPYQISYRGEIPKK